MNDREEPRYLSPNQLMERLNMSRSAVYGLLREEIPHYKVGASTRINEQEFEEWMLKQRVPRSWGVSETDEEEPEEDDESSSTEGSWWTLDGTETEEEIV